MNKTEKAAHEWLILNGYTGIVFRHRNTPDFLTKQGKLFEVKLVRNGIIWFSHNQFRHMLTIDNSYVLAFNNTGIMEAIIPVEDLRAGTNLWENIQLSVAKPQLPKGDSEHLMININELLTGTIVTDLTLAQQTMWFRLLGVAGKGHGRIGYVERAEGIGFSHEALLMELRCYTDDDKREASAMIEMCRGGTEPRIIFHDNNVIEIIKWDKYQYVQKGTIDGTVRQKKVFKPHNNGDKHAGMKTE
jgi:hypothetical protein